MGRVFVLSGPSGAGKTELARLLRVREPDVHYLITATTRSPRPGERHGVDYYFFSEADFLRSMDRGEFLECARIPPGTGFLYGSPRNQVEQALSRGQDVFAQVDVQGARSIRAQLPDAVLMFLKPPDLETLQRRLADRATEASDELKDRLENARAELAHEVEFDHSVINADGRLEEAVERVQAIMRDERHRPAERGALEQAEHGH